MQYFHRYSLSCNQNVFVAAHTELWLFLRCAGLARGVGYRERVVMCTVVMCTVVMLSVRAYSVMCTVVMLSVRLLVVTNNNKRCTVPVLH